MKRKSLGSEQIWQANEEKIKSKMRIFKTPPDSVVRKLHKENRNILKTKSKKMDVAEHPSEKRNARLTLRTILVTLENSNTNA